MLATLLSSSSSCASDPCVTGAAVTFDLRSAWIQAGGVVAGFFFFTPFGLVVSRFAFFAAFIAKSSPEPGSAVVAFRFGGAIVNPHHHDTILPRSRSNPPHTCSSMQPPVQEAAPELVVP